MAADVVKDRIDGSVDVPTIDVQVFDSTYMYLNRMIGLFCPLKTRNVFLF